MKLKVFAKLQDRKIRCEVLTCFENKITKKSYAIIFSPFSDEKDVIIPLIFDPTFANQDASVLVEDQDINVIEEVINKNACEIQYFTDEDITFEIRISQESDDNISVAAYELAKSLGLSSHSPFDIDDAMEAISKEIFHFTREEYVAKLTQKGTIKENVVLGWIQNIVEQKISFTHIPLNIIDSLHTSDEIIISAEEMSLKKSFENILKAFGKSEVVRQDVENALVAFAECNICTSEMLNTIMENIAFKIKFPQDVLQQIQSNIVLRVPHFFDAKQIKAAASYYYSKKEYDNSLKLYQKLYTRIENVELNRDEIIKVLNAIGNCYVGIMQFDNACRIFKQITEMDGTYAIAYNNWAYTLSVECDTISEKNIRQDKLQEALAYINEAIQANPRDVSFISNRAFIEYELGQYNQVIRDLKRARNISNRYADISTILKLAIDSKIRLSIISPQQNHLDFSDLYDDLCLIYKNETDGDKLYFEALDVYNKINNGEDDEKINQLIKELILLEFYVKELKSSITVRNPNQKIYYYTSIDSLRKLLCDEVGSVAYRLPIFHSNHMNDPSEGKELEKVLLKCVDNKAVIEDLFDNPKGITDSNRKRLESKFTFLKAFTKSADSLPMWIHYANAGKGCCVRVSNRFFTNFDDDLANDEKALINNPFDNVYRLYEILYIQNGEIVNKVSEEVNDSYKSMLNKFFCISSIYNSFNIETRKVIVSVISRIINKLKYLFKSADYFYEQEMRVVLQRPLTDLKRDDIDIQMTTASKGNIVPKVFVYTNKALLIDEVILGPKINETDDIVPFLEMKLLKLNDYDADKVVITKSEIEYR